MLNSANPSFFPHLPPAPPRAKSYKGLILLVIFLGIVVLVFLSLQTKHPPSVKLAISEFTKELDAGNVADLAISPDSLRGELRKPLRVANGTNLTSFRVEIAPNMGINWAFVQYLMAAPGSPRVSFDAEQNLLVNLLLPLVPWLLIFAFIWFFVFRRLRAVSQTPAPTPIYIVPNPLAPQPQQPPQP